MAYEFNTLKRETDQTVEWLKKEYSVIRTGRATPAILDGVKVEVYGSRMPLAQLATITSEGPKVLRVAAWDVSQAKNIEKAIQNANLGLSVAVDDKGIRVIFPGLSEERRTTLIKLSKQKLEEAKIKLRGHRENVWEDIQKKVKEGVLSEDAKFRLKNEMQKIVDDVGRELVELSERKEKEISEK